MKKPNVVTHTNNFTPSFHWKKMRFEQFRLQRYTWCLKGTWSLCSIKKSSGKYTAGVEWEEVREEPPVIEILLHLQFVCSANRQAAEKLYWAWSRVPQTNHPSSYRLIQLAYFVEPLTARLNVKHLVLSNTKCFKKKDSGTKLYYYTRWEVWHRKQPHQPLHARSEYYRRRFSINYMLATLLSKITCFEVWLNSCRSNFSEIC